MKRVFAGALAFGVALLPAAFLLAAPPTGTPSIMITSPQAGAVFHGSSLTVHVVVSNFELVAPVLKNPRPLKGNIGHIHYTLDGAFNPAQDASMSLTHTWNNVKPGPHTVTAYLATNVNTPFPKVQASTVHVSVTGGGPPPTPQAPATATPSATASLGAAPTTGGGAGKSGLQFNANLFWLGMLLIILGLLFFGRVFSSRFALANAVAGGSPAPKAPPPPIEVAFEGEARSEPAASVVESPSREPVVNAYLAPEPAAPAVVLPEPASAPSVPPPSSWQASPPPSTPMPGPAAERVDPQPALAPLAPPTFAPAPAADSRSKVVEMAQQWSGLVQDLVRQLEASDAERRQLQARISALEQATQQQEALRQAMAGAGTPISTDDLQAAQFAMDALLKDPDHIVVLASVAQNADRLARIVAQYARIRRAMGE